MCFSIPWTSRTPWVLKSTRKKVRNTWENCKLLVALNFPTPEAVDNFMDILKDYRAAHFTKYGDTSKA